MSRVGLGLSAVSGVLLGVTAFCAPVFADCLDPFANPDDILELHLRMSQADWSSIRFDGQVGSGCDAQFPYVQVDFRCGDSEPWISIGVRRKRGDQRGRDTDFKPPMKLDFNRFTIGQRWPPNRGNIGFRKLSLNNGQEDNPGGMLTALLSEHVAWRVMRREVPLAGGVAYARVDVNFTDDNSTVYHGLYILIEDIDRTALRARFGDADDQGTLLKTTQGSCRNRVVFDDGAPNPATDLYDAWSQADPDGNYPGGWIGETDRAMHLDLLLRQEAVRDILANGRDTPLGRNYSNFFSFDPMVGKRYYIPWDLDDAFRPYPQDVPFDTPMDRSCSAVGDLTRCNDDIRDRYLEIACQMINGTLSAEQLIDDWDDVDALIRPIIPDEIDTVWGGMDPLETGVSTNYQGEYERIRAWLANRIPFVRQDIESRGVSCPVGCPVGAARACDFINCPGERRCLNDRWTGCEPTASCFAPTDAGVEPMDAGADAGAPGDTGASGEDANFDAGIDATDTGVDSGVEVGTRTDAGAMGSKDATSSMQPGGTVSGSCGCRASFDPTDDGLPYLWAGLCVLFLRRRSQAAV